MSGEIHSVAFYKGRWTEQEAREWLRKHNLKPIKDVHITKYTFRYRIIDPEEFKTFSTIKTTDKINLIIGYK